MILFFLFLFIYSFFYSFFLLNIYFKNIVYFLIIIPLDQIRRTIMFSESYEKGQKVKRKRQKYYIQKKEKKKMEAYRILSFPFKFFHPLQPNLPGTNGSPFHFPCSVVYRRGKKINGFRNRIKPDRRGRK